MYIELGLLFTGLASFIGFLLNLLIKALSDIKNDLSDTKQLQQEQLLEQRETSNKVTILDEDVKEIKRDVKDIKKETTNNTLRISILEEKQNAN